MKDFNFRIRIIVPLIYAGFCFLLSTRVYCQEFSFREYGVRDGLPQSQAYVVYQDSRGFIWISTKNGLSRFDGIEFVNYHTKDGLPYNIVTKVFEDSSKKLWALTYNGLSEYEGAHFKYYPPGKEFLNARFGGSPYPLEKPDAAYLLCETPHRNYQRIVFFDSGIYSDYSSKYIALDTLKIDEMYFNNLKNEFLLTDKYQQLWKWSGEQLVKFNIKNVQSILVDHEKVIIKAGKKLMEYKGEMPEPYNPDPKQGCITVEMNINDNGLTANYFNGKSNVSSALPFSTTSYYIDREGTLWLSSESNISRFLSPAYQSWSEEKMNMSVPWAICPDIKGNLWIGSLYSDLRMFDGTTFADRNDYKKVVKNDLFFYKGSRLMSDGETWLSTNSCIMVWDGNKFSKMDAISEDVQVCYIYEDTVDHRKMIGTEKGLYIIKNGKVTLDKSYVDGNLGVIEGVEKDENGFYWLSGHNGLVRFNDTSDVRIEDNVLPSSFTFTLARDSRGGLWISSGEGLFFKKREESDFNPGLPVILNKPANVVSIINDSQLLVGRITDICLIDLDNYYSGDEKYFRFYDKTDGYPGAESLDNGIVKGKDGEVWILTSENLVRFDPSMIKTNKIPPYVNITGLFYETDSLTWENVSKGAFYYGIPPDIKLRRHQNRIRITYAGISTSNPEKVKYQYFLKGADQKWSLYSERREVEFINLQPGRYSFHLKAMNADGIETPEPLVLDFTISKAFWETKLFNAALILLIIIISVQITRYLIRRKNKINEEKHKLKSELIRLQMNSFLKEFDPHFTFNAISSIGSLIMADEKKAAYLYLTRLSSLMRASLKDSGSLIKSVAEELDFVTNYCELQKLRFGDRFSYVILIEDGVNQNREIPKMTIQTFVENSVKHGIENKKEGGYVEIKLMHFEDAMHIYIKDNGIGRSGSKDKSAGTGYGVKTIYRIFDILNGNNRLKASLEIRDIRENNLPAGTVVFIRIPDDYIFRIEDLTLNNSKNDIHIDGPAI